MENKSIKQKYTGTNYLDLEQNLSWIPEIQTNPVQCSVNFNQTIFFHKRFDYMPLSAFTIVS